MTDSTASRSARPDVEKIARRIRQSYLGAPIEPIRYEIPSSDIGTAYEIQEHNTRHWLAQGRELVGRKIGLTSKAVQLQLGVDQPDYGMLFADMQLNLGEIASRSKLLQPRIEGEIAVVLGETLDDAGLTEADLVSAIAYVFPALEIVDSRIRNWDISIVDTVADNASSGLFVLGGYREPTEVDVEACHMTLSKNGNAASRGTGKECLGSPYTSALWLARKMVEVGHPLRRGDIVMTGALGPMVDVSAGMYFQLKIDGFDPVSIFIGE
jgi:2-keto-4-pentenoate hydratase